MTVHTINGIARQSARGRHSASRAPTDRKVAPVSVVVASEIPVVREAVAHWLEDGSGKWQVADTCTDSDGLRAAVHRQPHAVVIASDGILTTEVLESVMSDMPQACLVVVMLPSRPGRTEREMALIRAGVRVILGPETSRHDLLNALGCIDSGRATLPVGTVDALLSNRRRDRPLTKRQLEILRLLATGQSTKAIADKLYITPDSVRSHARHIAQRCGLDTSIRIVAAHAGEVLRREDELHRNGDA